MNERLMPPPFPDDERGRARRTESAVAIFVLGVASGLFFAVVVERFTTAFFDRDMELLRAVRDMALEDFVSDVEADELVDDALRGMLSGLDRYSRYYGPDEIAQLDRETTGEFRGIGVVFRPPTERGQVLFPFPGSPAAEAGMRVGDRILSVGDLEIAGLERGELQRAIRSAGGDTLPMRVLGLDGLERELSLQLDRVIDPTVRHVRMLDPDAGIGYLAIVSFSHRTPEEFDRAVRQLQDEGMRALAIDLRSNPGGILEAAVKVANRFIPEGAIVATRTREETRVTEALSGEAQLADMPVVLLVDEGSASASEVLAGALQDHCAAALVGEPTYGKGTVQTLRRFSDDRAIVKITTAKYYTPAWRGIERDEDDPEASGIAPDLFVELSPEERQVVHRFLATYSPPRDVLPAIEAWQAAEAEDLVPDAPEDRQLDAAMALLSGRSPDFDVPAAE